MEPHRPRILPGTVFLYVFTYVPMFLCGSKKLVVELPLKDLL